MNKETEAAETPAWDRSMRREGSYHNDPRILFFDAARSGHQWQA